MWLHPLFAHWKNKTKLNLKEFRKYWIEVSLAFFQIALLIYALCYIILFSTRTISSNSLLTWEGPYSWPNCLSHFLWLWCIRLVSLAAVIRVVTQRFHVTVAKVTSIRFDYDIVLSAWHSAVRKKRKKLFKVVVITWKSYPYPSLSLFTKDGQRINRINEKWVN